MAVISLGLDLTRIDRIEAMIEKRGERFLDRIFTEGERAYCDRRHHAATHYAGRFAVKEAVMKCLGTGWARGVRWRDLEVSRRPGAAPELRLHGVSAQIAERRGIGRILITITHDAGIAAAMAVAESALTDGAKGS